MTNLILYSIHSPRSSSRFDIGFTDEKHSTALTIKDGAESMSSHYTDRFTSVSLTGRLLIGKMKSSLPTLRLFQSFVSMLVTQLIETDTFV